jgi:hypothetical protein
MVWLLQHREGDAMQTQLLTIAALSIILSHIAPVSAAPFCCDADYLRGNR